ncbi:hypothetical protein DRW03_07055 [Corallococcus sp. H22C18031201]|nr:hypothetical protein DRW03_07055 [Corallococcus sp. H22C18031201]
MEHNGRKAWPRELSEPLREVDRLRRSGRYAQALGRIRALAEAHPDQVRVLIELALTLGVWGRAPAEALVGFERVLELAPGHLATRFHHALMLARLGRHAEAVAGFDTAESGGFRKPLVLYMKRAESLEALDRLTEAERDWTLALAEDPGNAWLLQRRAGARARLGQVEAAIRDLSAALSSQTGDEVDAELLQARAVLRARSGDAAGARADFEAGIAALRKGDPPGLMDALRAGLRGTL